MQVKKIFLFGNGKRRLARITQIIKLLEYDI